MNKKEILEKITNNWATKVICLILAILVFIFHQVSLLDKRTFSVPLEVVSEGLVSPITELPSYVKISVRSKSDILATVTPASFKARINLNEYTEPVDVDVPVTVQLVSDLMFLDPMEIIVRPESFHISLDEKILKYIPVEPAISGEVDKGYSISNIEVVPSSVKVEGPAKTINKLSKIYTQKVNVKGASTSFSAEVGLDNIVKTVKPYPEGKFKVNIAIAQTQSTKTIEKILPALINVPEKFLLDGNIPYVAITLSGTLLTLEKITLSDIASTIDCSSVVEEGEYDFPIRYSVNANVAISEKLPSSIRLKFVQNIKEPIDEAKNNEDNVNTENASGE